MSHGRQTLCSQQRLISRHFESPLLIESLPNGISASSSELCPRNSSKILHCVGGTSLECQQACAPRKEFPLKHKSTAFFIIKTQKKETKNHSTQDSRVVPHRGTNQAALWLTSQIGRDAVLSESYGRGYLVLFVHGLYTLLNAAQNTDPAQCRSRNDVNSII